MEGLALDWISNNIYFSDRERSVIEVVRSHSSVGQLRRTILNSTHIDRPRGIAVNPIKGQVVLLKLFILKYIFYKLNCFLSVTLLSIK